MGHDRNAHIVGNGVHFSMHGQAGPLEVAIDHQALERYFGADADPQTWLAAYTANFRVIHALAQLQGGPAGRVSLRCEDMNEDHIRQLRQ